jgi:hypothetical protein
VIVFVLLEATILGVFFYNGHVGGC